MRKKFYISLFSILIALSASFSPAIAPRAQAYDLNSAIDQVKGVFGKISVPSIDIVGAIKTILNVAATTYAKQVISGVVNDTVKWANTGFNGNPAYVQNPRQFFLNTANNTAGSFINQIGKGKLGFLCSPFQKQIQLSLIYYYYQPANQTFQCTWTGITGNMQGFLSDFSQGGWDGWFSMTQVPTNNVYGAGVAAQLELSKQIQQTLGLKQQDYQVNQGFLSLPGDCNVNNPDQSTLDKIMNGTKRLSTVGGLSGVEEVLDDAGKPTGLDGYLIDDKTSDNQISIALNNNITMYDPNAAAGECIHNGPTKTPGTLIQSGLEKALGSGVDQLVNAQEFDQIASALMQGLLTRYVTGPKGLFGPHYKDGLPSASDSDNGHEIDQSTLGQTTPTTPTSTTLTCSASPLNVAINQPTLWSTNTTASNALYRWTGDALSDTQKTVLLSYTAPGTYKATVAVTVNGSTQTADCGSVTVTSTPPPSVSCAPVASVVDPGTAVQWTATVTGGSGAVTSAVWEDTSTSPNGDTSGESFEPSGITQQGGGTLVTTNITYSALGRRTASVIVRDANPQFAPVTASCAGAVNVGTKLQEQ